MQPDAVASHTWSVDQGTAGPGRTATITFSFELAEGWELVNVYADGGTLTGPDENGEYTWSFTPESSGVYTA